MKNKILTGMIALMAAAIVANAPAPAEPRAAATGFSYVAIEDFPDIDLGEVPYYLDRGRNALAINAGNVNFRDKWARAGLTFDGPDGDYDFTLTTLTEEDGESTYRLYINDERIGEHQNAPVDQAGDMQPETHVWPGVSVKQGDTISIESNPHTNGKIPEGDGTAWSRGRWRQLDLDPAD